MPTLQQVLGALQYQVSQAVGATGLSGVLVGTDFPSIKVLEIAVVRNGGAAIAILDRGLATDSTRWLPATLGDAVTAAGITTAVAPSVATPATPAVITIGGAPVAGDAVSAVLANAPGGFAAAATLGGAATQFSPQWATVANAGATIAATATALAAAITADPVLSTWARASASGPAVTVTPLVPLLGVASFAGNGGTRTTELGRRRRQIQVCLWTNTIEARNALGDAIETMLAELRMMRAAFPAGLAMADGTNAQITAARSHNLDDATLSDAYRRDFLVGVDHPVTTTDPLWSVLAAVQQFDFGS